MVALFTTTPKSCSRICALPWMRSAPGVFASRETVSANLAGRETPCSDQVASIETGVSLPTESVATGGDRAPRTSSAISG